MKVLLAVAAALTVVSAVGVSARPSPTGATGGTFSVEKVAGGELASIIASCPQFSKVAHVACSDAGMTGFTILVTEQSDSYLVSFYAKAAPTNSVVIRHALANFEVSKKTYKAKKIVLL